ncbi:MAG: glycosyltransferase family 39 protein [Chloroflexi bacterium]|nr:glycosyltransferase family 39 protein [Chloroflexota bacterium]
MAITERSALAPVQPPAVDRAPAAPSGLARWWGVGGLLALLAGALGLRLWLLSRAVGFEQGDPLEYVNIAYKMAFGIGIEWWDLRPLLLSLLYVPVLYVAQWWPDPTGEVMVRALRLVSALFGVGIVWLTYQLGRDLVGELPGLAAALLVAVNPVVNRLSISTYAELPSTFCILLSLWLLIRSVRPDAERRFATALGGGLALGLGCMIRYQAIFYLPPVCLWVGVVSLVLVRGSVRGRLLRAMDRRTPEGALALGFAAGLGLAVLAQAAIEQVAYGRPFHSLLASFSYNVTSGLAPIEFGEEPFDWYLRQTPSWLGVMTAALAAVGLGVSARAPRGRSWSLLGVAGLTMFLALCWLPHKEERFLSQIVPLAAIFAALGISTVARAFGWAWTLRATQHREAARTVGSVLMTVVIALGCAAPMLTATLTLDLSSNVGYVLGIKKAAELRPGATVGTVPWNVARPYAGTRLTLERMDRAVWERRAEVTRTIEQSDFLLFPEYWLTEDREIDKLVDARFRSIEGYDDGVVLYQSRRLEDPGRRRSR